MNNEIGQRDSYKWMTLNIMLRNWVDSITEEPKEDPITEDSRDDPVTKDA